MHVILFGGTGRTGRLILQYLQTAGHTVTVAARRPAAGADGPTEIVDLKDGDAVRTLASSGDAVISALASGKGNPACSRLAHALLPLSGSRFVTIGGAGVDSTGDAKALPDRIVGRVMKWTVGEMLADRQREHDMLAASDLRWTMLRPPRLTGKPGTGRYQVSYDTPRSTAISRADLAKAAVDMLDDASTFGKAPFVAG